MKLNATLPFLLISAALPATAQDRSQATVFHLEGYDLAQAIHRVEGLCIDGMGWPRIVSDNPDTFETGRIATLPLVERRVAEFGADVLYAVSPGCLSHLGREIGMDAILVVDPISLVD
ncbi:MAG: hypothetical protein AAGA70_06055 [Pseudomonadota bacterium]